MLAARSVDLDRDVLELGVLLHGVDRHVLAVAGLLVAAVRQLRGEWQEMVVDPHAAELELPRRVHRTPDVACPDRRREPVPDVVRPADRLVVLRELLHGDYGPEDLAL